MVVPKTVIRDFLGRQLDDRNRLLDLTPRQLRERMQELPVRPPIWKKLRREQKACVLAGAELGSFAYFLDTGVGKTLTAIALIRYFRKLDKGKRFLVLVPNKVNVGEWELEIQKHTPGTSYCLLIGTSERKMHDLLNQDAAIYVTTYAGLNRMACSLVENAKKKRKTLKMDDAKLKQIISRIDGVFADESVIAQNRNSSSFKVCRRLSKGCESFSIMCATPFNRDLTSLWSQMYLVDHGETLGRNLGLYREVFFKKGTHPFTGFPEWHFDKKKKHLLNRTLAHRSISVEADKSSLPQRALIHKRIFLPGSAEAFYKEQKARLVRSRGSYQESKNAFMRMRQISSGYIGYDDDELGVRAEVELHPNRKLEMLMSIVEEIHQQHKFVIFCDFVFSGSMISRELGKLKIGHGRIYGKTKDPIAVRKRFDTDDDMRGLILQNSCGGFGLNLQIAKWGIYYESPVSALMRKQTEARVVRQGTEHGKVFIVDLVVSGTVDDAILQFHREGRDLFEEIIRGKVSL